MIYTVLYRYTTALVRLSGAQSMAVAVGSAFLANLAAWNLQPQRFIV